MPIALFFHDKVIIIKIVLTILFFLAASPVALAQQKKPFIIYDATSYKKKPDLRNYGISPINLVYAVKFWEYGEHRATPNISKIAKVSQKLNPDVLLCVDIEDWPVKGENKVVEENIEKYDIVARTIQKYNPGIKFGFYGVLPVRDYWSAIEGPTTGKYRSWEDENKKLTGLARDVDVIFPSLYTFNPNQNAWRKYAIENIKQARIYKKPVYAFLWPKYHSSTIYKGRYIPEKFWRLQLRTCFQYTDGIVIWGGSDEVWDDNAPWWKETLEFLGSLKKKTVNEYLQ